MTIEYTDVATKERCQSHAGDHILGIQQQQQQPEQPSSSSNPGPKPLSDPTTHARNILFDLRQQEADKLVVSDIRPMLTDLIKKLEGRRNHIYEV